MIVEFNEKYNFKVINKGKILEELNKNPFGKCLLYIVNNDVIGYLYYSDIYERIEINQIEVLKEYQKKGYASELMDKLISNNKDITLEVRNDNEPAINLYKKYNFKEVAIRKNYYKNNDGILMERKKDS